MGALAEIFCIVFDALSAAIAKRTGGKPGCLALTLALAGSAVICVLIVQLVVWITWR